MTRRFLAGLLAAVLPTIATAGTADSLACARAQFPEELRGQVRLGYEADGLDGLPEFPEDVIAAIAASCLPAGSTEEQVGHLLLALRSAEALEATEIFLRDGHSLSSIRLDEAWQKLEKSDRLALGFNGGAGPNNEELSAIVLKLVSVLAPDIHRFPHSERLLQDVTAYALFRGILESLGWADRAMHPTVLPR